MVSRKVPTTTTGQEKVLCNLGGFRPRYTDQYGEFWLECREGLFLFCLTVGSEWRPLVDVFHNTHSSVKNGMFGFFLNKQKNNQNKNLVVIACIEDGHPPSLPPSLSGGPVHSVYKSNLISHLSR